MKRTVQLLPALMLAYINGFAQHPPPPTYNLRPVLMPGMIIDGHSFTKDTIVYHAVLNDSGEMALSASCDGGANNVAIFTSRRIIAKKGDVIDGKIIVSIPSDSTIAINKVGQVAYEAWYVEDPRFMKMGVVWVLGVFVEDRWALEQPLWKLKDPYTLSDNGQVVLQRETAPTASAPSAAAPLPQKKPGWLDRIRIKPPKLSKDIPISVGSNNSTQALARSTNGFAERPPMPEPAPSMLSSNRRGQVLIPVNFLPSGFVLLLGSPIKH